MVKKIECKIIESEFDRKCYSCGSSIDKGDLCIQEKHLYEVNPISYYYHPLCFAHLVESNPSIVEEIDVSFMRKLIALIKELQ